MKLATKKFFHNVLAIAVSMCMVCTMTPSLAWGAGNSGDTIEFDASAGGETKVLGQVRNDDFAFTSITPEANYADKAKFVEAVNKNPLSAQMKDSGLPDNFTVEWWIQEGEPNPSFDSGAAESKSNPKLNLVGDATKISSNTYSKSNAPKDDQVPTFTYPSGTGEETQPSALSMNGSKSYKFYVYMIDGSSGQKAEASTIVSLKPDYPTQVIAADSDELITVRGDIYQKFDLFNPGTSVVQTTEIGSSDDVYQNLAQAAADNKGGAEGIETAIQIQLVNNAKPSDANPYEGTLEVRIPVPEAITDPKEGATVNVYVAGDDGNVTTKKGKIDWAIDPNSNPIGQPLLDSQGNKIPVILVDMQGTGVNLGTFAVGVPATGSYYMTATASAGGQISPAGENMATAIGTATTYSAYAIAPQYKFVGFSLKVNQKDVTIANSDLGYNNVTITPNAYGIKAGDEVELKANYSLAVPGAYTRTLTARLINEAGASGSFELSTLFVKKLQSGVNLDKPGTGKDITPKGTTYNKRSITSGSYISNASVDRDAGLLLEFFPNPGSYVRDVLINGKSASFQGNSLMIGTVDVNTTIQVIYAPGTQPTVTTNDVNVVIEKRPSGNYPANMPAADGAITFDASYQIPAGGQLTIKATPYKDIYYLRHVYVYSPSDLDSIDASSTSDDVKFIREHGTDIINRVFVSPNNATSGYPQDEIQLYNISADTMVLLEYAVPPTQIKVEASAGGSWGWIPGEGATVDQEGIVTPNITPQRARVKAMSRAASPYSSSSRLFEQVETGTLNLGSDGAYARLVVRPYNGYQIGDISVNGIRINSLLTKRTGDDGDFYTVIVYFGSPGSAPDGIGDLPGDPAGPDKIFYTDASNTSVSMTFNAEVIEMPTFNLITTSVTEFGGGTITPTRNVEDHESVTINFFPDNGYKVENVWLDGELLFEPVWPVTLMPDDNYITIDDVRADHSIRVSFTPGESEGPSKARYTITASAGVGGSITPYGNFQVYEGDSQEFVLIPNTGYDISTVWVDGVEQTEDDGIFDSRNTISLTNIRKDTSVAVTFRPLGASNASTFTVTPSKEGQGRIIPSNAMTVGSGADAAFTIIPDDGWYVSNIVATYGTGSNITEVSLLSLYDKRNFTFQLTDVRENAAIKVTFAQGIDGKIPGTNEDLPKPPGDDKKITLGDVEYNPDKDPAGQNPGALLTPSLSDLEIIKEEGTEHAATDQMFTVTVMDGYELDTPIAGQGIVVKDGTGTPLYSVMGAGSDSGDAVVINQIGDGVFTVKVPKEKVTEGLSIDLNTSPKTASTESVTPYEVTVDVVGEGYITPGMTGVGSSKTAIQVAPGKNQSFNFFPADGWKLYTVYLNGTPTTVTDNFLTVPNIQQNTIVEAVFSKLEEGEQPPAKPKTYTVEIEYGPNSNGLGVSPLPPSPSNKITVIEHSSLTITATPKNGYKVTATDNGSTARVINNAIELGNITANHKIVVDQEQVIEKPRYFKFDVKTDGPGTASPSGTTLVVQGESQTITLVPDTGMKVRSVSVNGSDQTGSVDWQTMSLPVNNVSSDTQVMIEFCDPKGLMPSDPANDQPPADADITYYNVTTRVPDGGGMLSPASAKVAEGGSVNLTIMPNSGYELESIMVGSEDVTRHVDKAKNTLTVRPASDVTVSAKFKKSSAFELDDFYTLFINSEGDANGGGSVSPAGAITVPAGGSQVITIMPDPGYKVDYIEATHNGQRISRTDNYTGSSYTFFNVTQDMNINVKFVRGAGGANVLTHDITATSTVEGRISPEGTVKVADGANASFSFVPNPGYKLSYVNIDGRSISANYILNGQYIFSDVREDHTMHAVFAPEDSDPADFLTISVGKTVNGVITPSSNMIVPRGSNDRSLLISPFYGYKVSKVLVGMGDNATPVSIDRNGKFVEVGDTIETEDYIYEKGKLTFKNVQSNIRVSAEFARDLVLVPDTEDAPTYIPVAASTKGENGAGGTTILGSGGYVISPDFVHEPDPSELYPQIAITPNPGSKVKQVTLTYGDGSKVVTDENGEYVYDKDGYLLNGPYEYNADGTLRSTNGKPVNSAGQVAELDENGKPIDGIKYPSKGPGKAGYPSSTDTTSRTIYETGYVVMNGINAVVTNGITCDVIFEKLTEQDLAEIQEGTLTPAQFVEINITGSGGGRVFPEGRVKAAVGQGVVVQFMPTNGYEVSQVMVDGNSVIEEVMSNSTRNYIFQAVDQNHTLDCTFSFVGNTVPYYTVEATSNIEGGVNPDKMVVPRGSDPTVYFFPPAGKKVANVTVTKDGEEIVNNSNYLAYMYVASNIDGNIKVHVEYVDAEEGENTWTVKPIKVTANCPSNHGSVSPAESYVPEGASQTFFFQPESGYLVDYVMFNGVATTLKDNPMSFTVTPIVGAENNLSVFYREATSRDKKYITITPQLAEGSSATIEPSSFRAEVGAPVSFYVSPGAGQTIDSVTVDGWPVSVRPAIPEDETPQPNRDYAMYIVTINEVHANDADSVIVKTKGTTQTPIPVQRHTMTIRGENVLYSPMGSVQVPAGGSQTISVNPLSGYYLDSVIVTDRDASGNVVNVEDMTESVRANQLVVRMGAYDREVYIKYLGVGDGEKATPAYITLGSTIMDDGRNLNATISMQRESDGTLIPIYVDPETRMLMGNYVNDEGVRQPLAFVRGATYVFYASAEPYPDERIILSEATFNGSEQTVQGGIITGMKVNANGILDLVFRQLEEGEEPPITQTFQVKFRIVDEDGNVLADNDNSIGTVRPTTFRDNNGATLPMGQPTQAFLQAPEGDDNWMVASVTKQLYLDTDWDNPDSKMGALEDVNPSQYKTGALNIFLTQPANVLYEVKFVRCALVHLTWNEELGLVAPNAGKGKPLKLEASDVEEPYPFIVAPLEGCYVNSFDVAQDSNEPENFVNYNSELVQTEAAKNFLESSGYNILKFTDGGGQVTPENMDQMNDDLNTGEDQPATMSLMAARAEGDSWYSFKPIDYSVTVPDTSMSLQRPYSVLTELSPDESYVNVDLQRLPDPESDGPFTITPVATGEGGAISPSTPQIVDKGGSQTFSFMAYNGYNVKRVLVDGSPIGSGSSNGLSLMNFNALSRGELATNGMQYTFYDIDQDHTIEVEFAPITSDESSRLLRVASSLAQTGDLMGPAIGCLLIIAALGLVVTALSYIKRQRRRAMRRQGMR